MQPAAEPSESSLSHGSISVDPLASFVAAAIDLPVGEFDFEVEHRQADEWLKIFLDEEINFNRVLPDMLTELDQQRVETAMFEGILSSDDLARAAFDLITIASGRKWFIALSLCAFVRANWDRLGGMLILAGMGDPSRFTWAAWLDAVYSLCLQNMKPEDASKFVSALTTAPPGYEDEMDWENEEAAFESAMGMM